MQCKAGTGRSIYKYMYLEKENAKRCAMTHIFIWCLLQSWITKILSSVNAQKSLLNTEYICLLFRNLENSQICFSLDLELISVEV
jgi:hypothetical protein